MKRDTYSNDGSKRPRYPRTPQMEAALHLANTLRRYVNERANVADVDRAIEVWREAQSVAVSP